MQVPAALLEEVITFILGERRIYPTGYFQQILDPSYNMIVYKLQDKKLIHYFEQFKKNLLPLLESESVKKFEVIFTSVKSEKIIENWSCSISYENNENINDSKTHVAALLRQIQNSIAFLPVISNRMCKFDILIHCDKECTTNNKWEGIGPGIIPYEYTTEELRKISSSIYMQRPPAIVSAEQGPSLTWFDFVLDSNLFESHIEALKGENKVYPTAMEMLQMFIRPVFKTKFEKRGNARCTKLRDLCARVMLELSVSLISIEKSILEEHQMILVNALRQSTDPLSDIVLKRWILYDEMNNCSIFNAEEFDCDTISFLTGKVKSPGDLPPLLIADITYELGEYHFSKEEFKDAKDLFIITNQSLQSSNEKDSSQCGLESLQMACNSVLGTSIGNSESGTLIEQSERAKISQNLDEILEILLKDIQDPYLFKTNLPMTYRISLSQFFIKEYDRKRVHLTTCFGIIMHQISEELSQLQGISFLDDTLVTEFIFETCAKIFKEIDLKNPSKCFLRIRDWIRTLCYKEDSSMLWESLNSKAPIFIIAEDRERILALQSVDNVIKSTNIKSSILPLKRTFEDLEECKDFKFLLQRGNHYFSLNSFSVAEKYYSLAGLEGRFGVLSCIVKQDEEKWATSLTDELEKLINETNSMPSLSLLYYFIGVLISCKLYENLSILCITLDKLRCQLQKTTQDASLSTIGTTCDFVLNLCSLQNTLVKTDLRAEDLCKTALSVLGFFWKPYLATKIIFRNNEGLLPHIKDWNLLENILSAIVSLLYVNHVKNDAGYEEKSFTCQDHYSRFFEYQLGYSECLNNPDQRFASRVSSDGIAILSQTVRAITQQLLKSNPNHTPYLLHNSDMLYNEGKYQQALDGYLKAGALQTAFFTNPSPKFFYSPNTLHRMINCLHSLQATSQAIVMSQMVSTGDCSSVYRIIQAHPQTLNPKYFQYLWNIPILELLVSIFKKLQNESHCKLLIQILQKPEINQNNPTHILHNTVGKLSASFLRELLRDFMRN